jgi:peptidoglycan/LPS O-acetylase OafA/YrhL
MWEPRPEVIPALTGLRFIAAISVVLAHGLSATTFLPGAEPFWRIWLAYASAFGMSAFFVLSGFVIHYNYSDSIIEHRWRGAANFFSARFARLYPLYIVCVTWSLYDHGYFFNLGSPDHPELAEQAWHVAPFFLTMTQSWKFSIVGSNALIYGFPFSNVAAISWSVSTELFFYVVYPLICFGCLRLRTSRQTIVAIAAVSVVALGLMFLAYREIGAIDRFGVAQFGPIAGRAHGFQDSFVRWLLYFAPYSRLPEFILGCLVAVLYRQAAKRAPSAFEQRIGFIAAAASVAAIGGMMWIIADPSNPVPFLQFLHLNFGFALPVAILIFCAARYRNAISSVLSHRVTVRCGDASYSIYMLHLVIIESAGLNALNIGQLGELTSVVVLRLALAMLVTIGFALVTYQLIEVPARRWLRRLLTIETRVPAVSPAPGLTG